METTKQQILAKLEAQWEKKTNKIDWCAYETLIVYIMQAEMTCGEKLALCREALDAFTRRGHFIGQYIENV